MNTTSLLAARFLQRARDAGRAAADIVDAGEIGVLREQHARLAVVLRFVVMAFAQADDLDAAAQLVRRGAGSPSRAPRARGS